MKAHLLGSIILQHIFSTELSSKIKPQPGGPKNYFPKYLLTDLLGMIQLSTSDKPPVQLVGSWRSTPRRTTPTCGLIALSLNRLG